MKDKNGFAFIETITVLTLVTLSLTMLLASYYLIVRKSNENESYNKPSDKYLLNSMLKLGTSNECEISKKCNYLTVLSGKKFIKITPNNCEELNDIYGPGECKKVLNDLNIKYLYLVGDIHEALKDPKATQTFDNGTIEYMKTLKKCKEQLYVDDNGFVKNQNTIDRCNNPVKYLIGVFFRYDKHYFASIPLNE